MFRKIYSDSFYGPHGIDVTWAATTDEAKRHLEGGDYDAFVADRIVKDDKGQRLSALKLLEEVCRDRPNMGRVIMTADPPRGLKGIVVVNKADFGPARQEEFAGFIADCAKGKAAQEKVVIGKQKPLLNVEVVGDQMILEIVEEGAGHPHTPLKELVKDATAHITAAGKGKLGLLLEQYGKDPQTLLRIKQGWRPAGWRSTEFEERKAARERLESLADAGKGGYERIDPRTLSSGAFDHIDARVKRNAEKLRK
jgi:hypothetical protein